MIHHSTLMEIGLGELHSPSFIVSKGNPVTLTLSSTSENIPRGPFIKIQRLSEGQFITYGTPEEGFRVLKYNKREIELTAPGEYRVHRPSLKTWDFPLGVTFGTYKKTNIDAQTETTITVTPEVSKSSTPTVELSPAPSPTPTNKKLLPDMDTYNVSVNEAVSIMLNDDPSCTFDVWYEELPYNLWIENGCIVGVCKAEGEYEVGIRAKLGDIKDYKLITISVKRDP